jgi:hypothetical protein
MSDGTTIALLRAAIVERATDVAVALLGEPNRRLSSRRQLRFGNKGSVAVEIAGPKAGQWYDYENGIGGDLFDLIQRERGRGFSDAVEYAQEFVGAVPVVRAPPRLAPKPPSSQEDNKVRALAVWDEARPINDTPAAAYLAWRFVLEPALEAGDSVLRFHRDCPFGSGIRRPCMLALMRDIQTNEPRGIQRTALTPALMQAVREVTFNQFTQAGGNVERHAFGPASGTAIKLSADEDVTQGLTIGEGLETVLAAMNLGFRLGWALGGTSGIKNFPVLAGIECLTIAVDNDDAGQQAALECSKRWTSAGMKVRRVLPRNIGDDMNDVLRRRRVS